jgi:hypothetical protein
MSENKASSSLVSSEKRNPGFVMLRRGLKEHLHRSRMSPNSATLFVWLLLSAEWAGQRRACVAANYADLMRELGWTYSMARRSIGELTRKGYIQVTSAVNQHGVTAIKILKFDGVERDSAVSTSEHTKLAENPAVSNAVSSAVSSAVSKSEYCTEHSRPSNSQSQQDLQAPKNLRSKEHKNLISQDAVRRRFNAELPSAMKGFSSESQSQKLEAHPGRTRSQKLNSRLESKLKATRDSYADLIEREHSKGNKHPFGEEEKRAFAALRYQPDLKSPLLGRDFVFSVMEIVDDHGAKGVLPGNLCSKVIDFCSTEKILWPPDFQAHRDRLREAEREAERRHLQSELVRPLVRRLN